MLRPGEYLAKGQWLTSPNGICTAILQDDGNFVIYRQTRPDDRIVLWASSTMSSTVTRLCFGVIPRQLNLYGAEAQVRWSPQPGYEFAEDHVLRMGDDGNLAVLPEHANPYDYSEAVTRAWSTGTVVRLDTCPSTSYRLTCIGMRSYNDYRQYRDWANLTLRSKPSLKKWQIRLQLHRNGGNTSIQSRRQHTHRLVYGDAVWMERQGSCACSPPQWAY